MWKYIIQLGRPQMTIWRTLVACSIPKVTDTHSEYVILIAFLFATAVARTRFYVTLHVHCPSFCFWTCI